VIILFLLFCDSSIGQTTENIKVLKQKFTAADFIVLISHTIAEEYAPKEVPDWDVRDNSMNLEKWKALHPVALKFLINGKLNRQVIRESVSLNDSSKLRLSNILLRKVLLNHWTPANCDQPQHAIIFYKNNNELYIDICFSCHRIHSSKDIDFNE
jgi:hypothetical protein